MQFPLVWWPHSTFAEGTSEPTHSRTKGLGDVTVETRWQGLSRPGSLTGLEAGLVLPTGAFHQRFDSGPGKGDEVDRELQPGSGTIQAMLGAYHVGALAKDLGYFAEVRGQTPLTQRELYKPSSFVQAAAALNFTRWRGITPQLQISFRATGREGSQMGDRENSGGEQISIAPGLLVHIAQRLEAFGSVEVPLHTRVNGLQSVAKAKATVAVLLRL